MHISSLIFIEFYIHPSDGGASNMGYFYPINKTYTIGLNVKF